MVEFPMVVRPPEAGSFNQPGSAQLLAQGLASLPSQYQQGFENQRKREMMNAFPNGMPMKEGPDGRPVFDYDAAMNTIVKLGGTQALQPLLNTLLENQFTQEALTKSGVQNLDPYYGGGAPSSGGQQGGYPGQRANAPYPQQPDLPPSGADNRGQENLASLASTSGVDLTKELPAIAAKLGVNPGDALPAQLIPDAKAAISQAANAARSSGSFTTADGRVIERRQQPPLPPGSAAAQPLIPKQVQTETIRPPVQEASAARPNVPGATSSANLRMPEQQQRPALPGQQGQQQAQAGQARQPAQPTQQPVGMRLEDARNFEEVARRKYSAATAVSGVRPQTAATLRASADADMARAKQIYEYHSKLGEQEASRGGMSPVELEEAKARGTESAKRFGETYVSTQNIGKQADETLPQVELAKRYTNTPGFYSGIGVPYVDALKRAGSALGMGPNIASPGEVFDKIRAGSILNQIKGMAGTGPVRVAEMRFIEHMIAGRENTPATLRALLEIESRLMKRGQTIRDMANDYNSGALDAGFNKKVATFVNSDKQRLFTQQEMDHPELLGIPQAPANLRSERELALWGKSMGLKAGDPVRGPDGKKIRPMPAIGGPP